MRTVQSWYKVYEDKDGAGHLRFVDKVRAETSDDAIKLALANCTMEPKPLEQDCTAKCVDD